MATDVKRGSFGSLYERLVANMYEPHNEQACWFWGRRLDREGYGLVNVYVPGLAGNATLKVHVLIWVLMYAELEDKSAQEAFLAYKELTASGLHLDHLCMNKGCFNPDHLDLVTASTNMKRRSAAYASGSR